VNREAKVNRKVTRLTLRGDTVAVASDDNDQQASAIDAVFGELV
jgi:hypothetical protein